MASTDELRAVMESTLTKFFENSTLAVKNKDTSLYSALLSPDCRRYMRPASFVKSYPFIKAVETNAEYEARMAPEIAATDESRVKIIEMVIDPIKRHGSAHVQHWSKIKGREPIAMEMCWYVDFTEDGKKISRIVEFLDTAASSKLIDSILKMARK
ncbi:uncharacterized protein F4812DRAFT_18365 [Daldinia caldariorum]|uniref:uncharacterized protein n=1 Tax=Daldinia caldariorum TaxID=326644 RepID=UPI002007DAC3|nr:uncharacterized protein F4812DRAFT_18365 [Daldinia caldariorum]KAI1472588.1 hypothetical protein F4812DRAFT_18365 [Daldinia caldariorum]